MHKALNLPFFEDEFQVNTVLQSIKRKLARVPFQVLPITPEILCAMYEYINIENPAYLALWSSFLVAFCCLFRKANVAPKTLQNFDPIKELSRRKLVVIEEENVVLVYNNWSKTNQFLNRDSIIPLFAHNVQALDPVFHLKKLLSKDLAPDTPAFSFSQNGVLKCITYDVFPKRLK